MLNFLADILQRDFCLVLDSFAAKRSSHYVELYAKLSDYLMIVSVHSQGEIVMERTKRPPRSQMKSLDLDRHNCVIFFLLASSLSFSLSLCYCLCQSCLCLCFSHQFPLTLKYLSSLVFILSAWDVCFFSHFIVHFSPKHLSSSAFYKGNPQR